MFSAVLGRSAELWMVPQNASSVHSASIVPGRTVRTGATPPNVNAYCSRSGRNSTTSIGGLPLLTLAALVALVALAVLHGSRGGAAQARLSGAATRASGSAL